MSQTTTVSRPRCAQSGSKRIAPTSQCEPFLRAGDALPWCVAGSATRTKRIGLLPAAAAMDARSASATRLQTKPTNLHLGHTRPMVSRNRQQHSR